MKKFSYMNKKIQTDKEERYVTSIFRNENQSNFIFYLY